MFPTHSCTPTRRFVIVLKLPLSVSMMNGSPPYLLLYKALNGLRDASLHWLNLLNASIRGVGLVSDEVEPCIYQVIVNGEIALLVAYVDDLLLCCQTARSEKLVFFPSNAFMASARSFNTFNCMLQIRFHGLISAYTWPSAD